MVRLGAVFVAICIVLIAASGGVGAYLYFGLTWTQAASLAAVLLVVLGLCAGASGRRLGRIRVETRIADLSRAMADVTAQLAELGRRVAAVEARPQPVIDPLVAELGELGTLVKHLAETVAAHDAALNGKASPATARSTAEAAKAPSGDAVHATDNALKILSNRGMIAKLRAAADADRIDLHLQPIVTLPQRKVRYYEALSRLRTESGDLIPATDFIDHADVAGVMAKIDHLALFRAVQVVRRLTTKKREIGVFCNIAASTLADFSFFPELTEAVEANPELTSALVFEFSQETVRGLGPIEQESLAALAERGFRFSMDRVGDLRLDPRDLANRGFRFVKVAAALLLDQQNAGADIHPADLSDLLGRFGIKLIADHIENESVAVDLLDFDVGFGQGLLFSPPRPVRREAIGGEGERAEGLAEQVPLEDEKPPAPAAERNGGRPAAALGPRRSGRAQLARGVLDPA